MTQSFFNTPREQSSVKATIVSKYFVTWASIIIEILKRNEQNRGYKKKQIAYIDLFSGPGKYNDGKPSTPVLVLKKALKSPEICDRILITFNDGDSNYAESLRQVINSFEGIERFRFRPKVFNKVIRRQAELLKDLPQVPTLLFVDAFGYKEISIELIDSVLRKWGSGCIFFFNYNRINMAVDNPRVTALDALFGPDRADKLHQELGKINPEERELTIIEEFSTALKESSSDGSSRYVLPFRFRNAAGSRTSHHLIHVSRHFLGYDKMKEIMAKESSNRDQSVPSFEYNPATERQRLLFSLSRTLGELGDILLQDFAGQSLTMSEIYKRHSVDMPFIKGNYKDILWQLFDAGRINVSRSPRRNTFADNIVVTFPPLP